MTRIKDSIVLVTGASAGIGLAVCHLLGKNGARLVMSSRNRDALESARAQLDKGVNAIVQQADVGSRSDVKALVERTKQEYGRLDILINNAGIGLFQTITESTSEDIATVMATNFFGALNCIQECVPIMRAQKSGHIVNVSSIIGMHSVYHQGIYAASKAALNRVSESLHAEEGKNGIKVSLVVPERTDTKFLTRVTGPTEKAVLPGGDMRMLTADQVARGIISAVENDQILHYSSLKGRIFGALTGTFPQVIRHVLRPPT